MKMKFFPFLLSIVEIVARNYRHIIKVVRTGFVLVPEKNIPKLFRYRTVREIFISYGSSLMCIMKSK